MEDVKTRGELDGVQVELARAGQSRVTGLGVRWGKVGTSDGVPASSLRRQELSVRAWRLRVLYRDDTAMHIKSNSNS